MNFPSQLLGGALDGGKGGVGNDVRHKDAIATGIAVVGSLVGVASVVSGFLR